MADFEMRLGWVIVYVDEPAQAAAFYERVFAMKLDFAFDTYAQLDTGATKLGFAAYTLGEDNFDGGVRRADAGEQPPNVELALVHEDVDGAQVLAFLSAWPSSVTDAPPQLKDDRQWRRAELWDRSRAAENSIIVASANQTGEFGVLRFVGGARIVDPGGDIVAATGSNCGLACASFDVEAALERARRPPSPIRDLRPDLYRVAAPLAV